jgi:hypothetical protein
MYEVLKKQVETVIDSFDFVKSEEKKLFDLVVQEYEDCGDDPDEAEIMDIIEIAQASGIKIKEDSNE